MKFRDEFFFLSNFYPCSVKDPDFPDITYFSVEAAFQAQKVLSKEDRILFVSLSPSRAKQFGRRVSLRKDWEDVKIPLMKKLLQEKFSSPELAEKLKLVKGVIIEDNNWNDRFWGMCKGYGLNNLGKLLMEIRNELLGVEKNG